MKHSVSLKAAYRFLTVFAACITFVIVATFHASAIGGTSSAPALPVPLPGLFYTVTGTADNTDATVHGGTGTAGDPFQMSSLRGAILNANTQITSATGAVTISVPAGTYLLSINNPNTPALTGTINFPDLEVGSATNRETLLIGTGGTPKIQQAVAGNDVITTGFTADGFTPVAVTLTLQNLEITGGSFSGVFTGVDNSTGRSNTTINSCNIHNNSNPFGQGGGIFNQTGNLTITDSNLSNNTASQQGGALFYDLPNSSGAPGTFGNLIITGSTFSNNTATANNNVAGGAVAFFGPNRPENTYSIAGSTFTNNHATGSASKGGAIGSGALGTLNVSLSRFTGNTATGAGTGVAAQGATLIAAINNWWGCDDFPGALGCDTASGSGVSTNPRLDLVVATAPTCDGTTVTADFSTNSANSPVSPTVLNGLNVAFAVVGGPAGATVTPPSATINSFMASTNLNAPNGGTAIVSTTLDNGTQNVTTEINKAVTVTTNPTDQTVCDGDTVMFAASASGNPTPTVQWQVSTNGGASFSDIPGETTPVLSFNATAAQNGNQYRAVFTQTCGTTPATATTTAATLTVNAAPAVSANPTDTTVCEGAFASFSAAANGSSAVQWQVSINGGASFTDITGATSGTLTFATNTSQNGNRYRAVFTSTCGTATSSAAVLTVNANTTATLPADVTVCEGAMASFSTTAGGTGPFHYAWTLDGSPFNGDSSSINVATGALSVGSHAVTVTVTGACGSITKNATLTIKQNTSTTKPNDQAVCAGSTASFSTTAAGTGPFTFLWRKGLTVLNNGDLGGRVTIITSSATSTLSISNVQASDAAIYTVETTGSCNTATQNATLAVNSAPPTVTLNGATIALWPPNHQYRTINVTDLVATASDSCDPSVNINSVIIAQVTSDEPDDNPSGGDGNTSNDIVIAPDCKSVQLRAERDGNLNGRVYTISFIVRDAAGHTGTATAKVTVPKVQNGAGAIDDGPHYTVMGSCP
jgi:hypothetical protein